ncbi:MULTISPECIES: type II secretion system protein GspD [Megamonas]|uniref:type II secretion system protein GspD n=1 Tax=Megamonas TaxID=158846 RepID=UPI000E3FDF63|nr:MULTISPECIES: hypothetical protein [Megamonas]RGO06024.1 hypothetical protein DXB32_01240 [Megamonas rupellensis]
MKKIANKVVLTALPLSIIFTPIVQAAPSQEAMDFAAQFKKEDTPKITAEDVLKRYEQDKHIPQNAKNVEITRINETPVPINLYGEGVPTDYQYIPTANDDVELKDEPVSYGPKYNFDWQGAPLTAVFYSLGKISGDNILVVDGDDLTDVKVYATLKGVTLEDTIAYLTAAYNLNWSYTNSTYRIAKDEDTMLTSQRFNVRYADKEKLITELKGLGIDDTNIVSNDQYSTVTVTGNSYEVMQAGRLIASIDKPVSQCLIVAQLIETTHTDDLDAGFTYSMPSYVHNVDDPLSHQNWGTKLTFGVTSQFNEAISKGKVMSRPVILTENGYEAELFMGDSVPIPQQNTADGSTNITFDYQDVGSTLKIKPAIDKASGIVSLNIEAEIKNIVRYIEQGGMQAPQIASREAKTVAHLKSGQTFVIGGLMSKEDFDTISGIPLLRKLPLLGKLFEYHTKNKSNTEVFITITPYIVNDGMDSQLLNGTKKEDKLLENLMQPADETSEKVNVNK